MPDQQQRADPASWVGRVLAGHRIDALVGEGGMGVVYRATHLRLRRTVALKVLPPSLAADQDYRRRFEREAAIAASLEHPNVVPIYDAGHTEGVLYLSMRFVDGEDLGVLLQREGPLGIGRLCAILGPVADALDAVHEAGLVHRDVKPGNILLAHATGPRTPGRVYLCDFGIAKGAASDGQDITSAGHFIGTLRYSSPEQIEGRWLDGRSDQYGLACLVYRCLTGRPPYDQTQVAAVIYAHLAADPPRLARYRPDLPPAVDAAVARATSKHPDHRFPTCSAFLAALRAAAAPVPAPRPRPLPRPGAAFPPPATAPTRIPPGPPARPPLPPTLPLPEPARAEPAQPEPARPEPARPEPAARKSATPEPVPPASTDPGGVPAPTDVHAERAGDGRSITVTWTAGGPQEVEYKITRLAPDGRWQVVGRTRETSITDGAVAPDAAVPAYGVVARADPTRPPATPAPDDFPPVTHLAPTPAGRLEFEWPPGITEAMVVVRPDRSPETPDDPAATAWKITNMRYQLDGGLLLPPSVARPCHVAVASCRRIGGSLVVAPGFDPTAHATVGPASG